MTFIIQDCQQHCKHWIGKGCIAFIYEETELTCTLYNDISHIEYDRDENKKVMGLVDGCFSCLRPGWDYGKN